MSISGLFMVCLNLSKHYFEILFFSLITFKLLINIVLLGHSCDLIEEHRNTLEKKIPQPRQCTSLPASCHNSMEDIPAALNAYPKSTPHTPSPSASSSLADITAQAAIMQETLETSMILSDSTVSLMSLDINDGSKIKLLADRDTFNDNQENMEPSLVRQLHKNNLRRRVSLQEVSSNSKEQTD